VTPPAGNAATAGCSGPSSSASYCAWPGRQGPSRSAAASSGRHSVRLRSKTIVSANEVLGRLLEFIVHAPLESTRPVTPILSAANVEGWVRVLVPLPQPRPSRQRRLHSFSRPQSREEKNGRATKHDT